MIKNKILASFFQLFSSLLFPSSPPFSKGYPSQNHSPLFLFGEWQRWTLLVIGQLDALARLFHFYFEWFLKEQEGISKTTPLLILYFLLFSYFWLPFFVPLLCWKEKTPFLPSFFWKIYLFCGYCTIFNERFLGFSSWKSNTVHHLWSASFFF